MTTKDYMANNAGDSSRQRFQDRRVENLKREWRVWSAFIGVAVVAVVLMVNLGDSGLALGGWMLGFTTAIVLFGWMIAFDVHAMPLLWGSWGEEQTGEELAKLGPDWHVRHDVANPYGNWDHIVVGPPGVFMIDTKRLSREVIVRNDGLSSGRTRFPGGTFRGASVGLREALQAHYPPCPWVQAVVAVWGDFPGGPREEQRVAYVSGTQLIDWLHQQPTTLDRPRCESLAEAVQRL